MEKNEFIKLILKSFWSNDGINFTRKRFSEEFSYKKRIKLSYFFLILFLISIFLIFIFANLLKLFLPFIIFLGLFFIFSIILTLFLILAITLTPFPKEKFSYQLVDLSISLKKDSKIIWINKYKKLLTFIKDEIRTERDKITKEVLIRNYIFFKEILPPLLIYKSEEIKEKISEYLLNMSTFKDIPDLYERLKKFIKNLQSFNEFKIIKIIEEKIKINKTSDEIINYFRYNDEYKNKFKLKHHLLNVIKFVEVNTKFSILIFVFILLIISFFFPNPFINNLIEKFYPLS